MTKLVLVILGSIAIASCGGGGGGETSVPTYLDTTFGKSGKVTTGIDTATVDSVAAIAIQSLDGKIVVVGNSDIGGDSDFAMARYNSNGDLDIEFSGDGKLAQDFGGGGSDYATSVAIQAVDGKIVVAGYTSTTADKDFVLTRYNINGSIDTTFGPGGIVITGIGTGSNDIATSVAIQAVDGKIVVAGYTSIAADKDFVLTRYDINGNLDTTFGAGGKVKADIRMGRDDIATSVAIQDGNIVVAGYSFNGTDNDFVLTRYTSAGALDINFGTGGKVIIDIGMGSDDIATSIDIEAGGQIVVAGSSGNDFALARYTADGILDTNFGTGGTVATPIGVFNDNAYSVAIQTDGKIVAAGRSYNTVYRFALTRYNTNGSLDTSFGAGGKVTTTAIGAGGDEEAHAVAIQADGKIVAAGFAGDDFALVRYLP